MLAVAAQLGLRGVQVSSAVVAVLGNDAAHRLDHLGFVRIKKRLDGGVALGHQRAVVKQVSRGR